MRSPTMSALATRPIRLIPAAVLLAAGACCCALAQPGTTPAAAASTRWTGPGSEPLPFTTDEEVLEFLRTAEIVGMRDIPVGVTEPRVVTLERDGVRARAAFHDHHIIKERQRLVDGSAVMFFRDSYTNQAAAYEMARLLGIVNTPPTVLREVDGSKGSLQLWIENAMTESDRRRESLAFPDRIKAYRQVYDMDIFDALINNLDRSQGNFLWGRQSWDLWMIDHTRAFGRDKKVLEPKAIRKCSRRLWERLKRLEARSVKERLAPYMSRLERSAVVARHRDLLKLMRKKIQREGEDEVLFSYADPGSVTVIQGEEASDW